mmetsp:Transcript_8460/g.21604  ORF Transcript_8460/g.21604 Transcript_8460/m.21604 type:complete len:152 (-) Transcript_8460:172-627(-)
MSQVGWAFDERRKLFKSATQGAALELRVECAHAGCGIRAGLTRSYQPLGTVDVLVDGVVRTAAFSQASPNWRARKKLETVNYFVTIVEPARFLNRSVAQQGFEPLAAGNHTVEFRCRGETEAAARSFPSAYRPHEVQVRSVVVYYEPEDAM